MKKIVSLGVASAVLALTAVAASAATSENSVKAVADSGNTYATGSEVSFDIVAVGSGVENAQLYFDVEGLEFVDATADADLGFMALPNADNNFLAIAGGLKGAAPDGAVIATAKFTVTAAEGEAVKFALKADPDYTDVAVDTTGVVDTAAAAGTSEPTSGDNSDESSDSNGGTTNPGTGIALAVVPAVIAGAAVVVAAKKRK